MAPTGHGYQGKYDGIEGSLGREQGVMDAQLVVEKGHDCEGHQALAK